ncbi:MAG TPA: glycosyltransferase 87 family protein [Ohtaekwangia sp.]|nr:glycosyltransferase 87 family protein [Ohtaekwangia sp.]
MNDQKGLNYFVAAFLTLLYAFVAYDVQRYDTVALLLTYSGAFGAYLWIVRRNHDNDIRFWLYTSILARSVLVFSTPLLSDDFYRFIWDGRLLAGGHHPFAFIPSWYTENQVPVPGLTQGLYEGLNSKDYFTIYPPVAQFVFWLAAKVSPDSIYGSVVFMKLIIFIAEIGTLFLMQKLLRRFSLPAYNVLLYAWNPLVILELVGNVHFEGILIFFLLLSIHLLTQEKYWQSALAFALAICTKLLPVLLLPVMIARTGVKRSLIYYALVGNFTLLLFLPLYDPAIVYGFAQSFGYYFHKFEFNASLYYLLRTWGFWYFGYNIIQGLGWILAGIAACAILGYAYAHYKTVQTNPPGHQKHPRERYAALPGDWMWMLLIYFFCTTTLHPWYIITPLALSIFTKYRFMVVWTLLIFFSYAGYTNTGFVENYWITAIEYLSVITCLVYELRWKKEPAIKP